MIIVVKGDAILYMCIPVEVQSIIIISVYYIICFMSGILGLKRFVGNTMDISLHINFTWDDVITEQ